MTLKEHQKSSWKNEQEVNELYEIIRKDSNIRVLSPAETDKLVLDRYLNYLLSFVAPANFNNLKEKVESIEEKFEIPIAKRYAFQTLIIDPDLMNYYEALLKIYNLPIKISKMSNNDLKKAIRSIIMTYPKVYLIDPEHFKAATFALNNKVNYAFINDLELPFSLEDISRKEQEWNETVAKFKNIDLTLQELFKNKNIIELKITNIKDLLSYLNQAHLLVKYNNSSVKDIYTLFNLSKDINELLYQYKLESTENYQKEDTFLNEMLKLEEIKQDLTKYVINNQEKYNLETINYLRLDESITMESVLANLNLVNSLIKKGMQGITDPKLNNELIKFYQEFLNKTAAPINDTKENLNNKLNSYLTKIENLDLKVSEIKEVIYFIDDNLSVFENRFKLKMIENSLRKIKKEINACNNRHYGLIFGDDCLADFNNSHRFKDINNQINETVKMVKNYYYTKSLKDKKLTKQNIESKAEQVKTNVLASTKKQQTKIANKITTINTSLTQGKQNIESKAEQVKNNVLASTKKQQTKLANKITTINATLANKKQNVKDKVETKINQIKDSMTWKKLSVRLGLTGLLFVVSGSVCSDALSNLAVASKEPQLENNLEDDKQNLVYEENIKTSESLKPSLNKVPTVNNNVSSLDNDALTVGNHAYYYGQRLMHKLSLDNIEELVLLENNLTNLQKAIASKNSEDILNSTNNLLSTCENIRLLNETKKTEPISVIKIGDTIDLNNEAMLYKTAGNLVNNIDGTITKWGSNQSLDRKVDALVLSDGTSSYLAHNENELETMLEQGLTIAGARIINIYGYEGYTSLQNIVCEENNTLSLHLN